MNLRELKKKHKEEQMQRDKEERENVIDDLKTQNEEMTREINSLKGDRRDSAESQRRAEKDESSGSRSKWQAQDEKSKKESKLPKGKKLNEKICARFLTLLYKPENRFYLKLTVYLWLSLPMKYIVVSFVFSSFLSKDPELKKLYLMTDLKSIGIFHELVENIDQTFVHLEEKVKETSEYYRSALSRAEGEANGRVQIQVLLR